jgi:predicted lipid-binding transport protein (Tim44 family)
VTCCDGGVRTLCYLDSEKGMGSFEEVDRERLEEETKPHERADVVLKQKKRRTAMMMGMMMIMFMGTLLFFALVAGLIWLSIYGLNKRKMSTLLPIPQQQDSYQPYEQGYQPPQRAPETYQEGGQQYSYEQPQPKPEYDQPQAQYPQPQELPPQY